MNTKYMPSQMVEWIESPEFAAKHWRNVPETEESALESFLSWLEDDYDYYASDEIEAQHKALVKAVSDKIDRYLGRDKAGEGERVLLDRWVGMAK